MGRIFEKRKDRMFARWSKTAKAFTKLGKEIAIAVKLGGPDPDGNPRLRAAVQTARHLNMPKDRIEAAIQRAAGKDEASLLEINYAGYGPHGIALFVCAATDNPTRTVANVRSIFTHHEGTMAASGALDFLFKHQCVFKVKAPQGSLDDLELALIDHGLEELEREEGELIIIGDFAHFGSLQREIEAQKLEIISSSAPWVATTTTSLTEDQEKELRELIEELEEDDDVQHVFDNIG